MSNFRRLLSLAYNSAYDLGKKKNYGKVSIYDGEGDLSKRWYVYYSFRNPATGKLVRQTPIYTGLEDHTTYRERMRAAKVLRETVEKILENGYNPYTDESKGAPSPAQEIKYISQGIDFALVQAKKLMAETAYPDFKSRVKQFQKWLIETGQGNDLIRDIEDTAVIDFLNVVLQRSSAANRNNTRTAISQLFKIFKDNKIVKANIVEDINVLKAKPQKNKSFTTDQEEKILDLLAKEDPLMLLYVGFVSINLLRGIEVNRLKVGDISIRDRILKVRAKNQAVKTKIIPEMLLRELPDLSKYDTTDYLFTPTGPGPWETKEVNRRTYFTDRFKNVVKDKLGLGEEYGIYSFRHTYITKLYRALRENYSPFEAKSRLMQITGHSTMKALEAYLREIDAELPEDYSHMLEPKARQ